MRKPIVTILVVLILVAAGGGAYYAFRGQRKPPEVTTAPITTGDVVDAVAATGTIEAVTTVQVGSQVSGTVQDLYADFNSIVHKDQVLARLNPSLFQTQIEQAKANLLRAQADTQRLRVEVDDAQTKLNRAQQLAKEQLISQQDLEAAELAVKSARAQLQSSEAQVTQAQASLNQNQVNLEHTVITAPIDGIVISRSVDVGQTVAASFQAPVLFILAADLTRMQVKANVDEADAGRIRPKQNVRFRVDAYPNEDFTGQVSQLRLQPTVVQNVVTYTTVIDVPNPELKLKPGMTANVNIEVARRENVRRVPTAALRFRPTPEMFAAFNQPVPEELQRGRGRPETVNASAGQGAAGGSGASASGGGSAPATSGGGAPAATNLGAGRAPAGAPGSPSRSVDAQAPRAAGGLAPSGQAGRGQPSGGAPAPASSADGQPRESASDGGRGPGGGGNWQNMSPEERRQRFMSRLQQMSPEEREQALRRMRDRGIDTSQFGQAAQGAAGQTGGSASAGAPSNAGAQRNAGAPGDRGGRAQGQARQSTPSAQKGDVLANTSAQTIDSLFGPLPVVETRGRAWTFVGGQLKPLRLRLGVSDGTFTEVLNEEIKAGTEVVTGITLDTPQTTNSPVRSPFTPAGRGGPPGGGRPGGH